MLNGPLAVCGAWFKRMQSHYGLTPVQLLFFSPASSVTANIRVGIRVVFRATLKICPGCIVAFFFPLKFDMNVQLPLPQLSFEGILHPKLKFHPFPTRRFFAGVTFSNSYNRAEEKAGNKFHPLPTQWKTWIAVHSNVKNQKTTTVRKHNITLYCLWGVVQASSRLASPICLRTGM